MKINTPETIIYSRKEFDAMIATLCGWTGIDDHLNFGTPPGHNAGAGIAIPAASQSLVLAWGILQHCQRESEGESESDGKILWEKMVKLLPPDELWALAPDDAAHMICNAFHEAHTGCDVEIEDLEDWED